MTPNPDPAARPGFGARLLKGSVLMRVGTALVLIPLAMVLLWVPQLQIGFTLFVMFLAVVGLYEFYAMCRAKGLIPETIGGMMLGAAAVLSAQWSYLPALNLIFVTGIVLIAWLHILSGNNSLPGIAASTFGLLYVGWMPAHFVLIHSLPSLGPGLVTILIVAVALSDTGAYFTGMAIGKHKLAPKVSPAKTWEGSIGGVLAACAGMVLFFLSRREFGLHFWPDWSILRYVVTGAILAVTGQVGDLAESMMKRDAGVKDSGSIFPGHGGVLDRCDGFLFAGPILYYLLSV